MLDLRPEQNQIDLVWDKLEVKARLPENMTGFFDEMGLAPSRSGCRRAYQRYLIRGKAIFGCHDSYYGVYSADASRGGIRFLSPIELRPKERARIRLPSTKEFHIEIVRSHRLDDACYDCGAIFVLGK